MPRASRPARAAASARTSTTSLAGKDAAFIEQSIVDPNADIAQGYHAGVMPQDFEQQIPGKDLDALVQYILDQVNQGAAKGG